MKSRQLANISFLQWKSICLTAAVCGLSIGASINSMGQGMVLITQPGIGVNALCASPSQPTTIDVAGMDTDGAYYLTVTVTPGGETAKVVGGDWDVGNTVPLKVGANLITATDGISTGSRSVTVYSGLVAINVCPMNNPNNPGSQYVYFHFCLTPNIPAYEWDEMVWADNGCGEQGGPIGSPDYFQTDNNGAGVEHDTAMLVVLPNQVTQTCTEVDSQYWWVHSTAVDGWTTRTRTQKLGPPPTSTVSVSGDNVAQSCPP